MKELTLSDFKQLITELQNKEIQDTRKMVVYTGSTGYFMFDLAMRGIKLPDGVTYSITRFKKLYNILYINIGRKESSTKIKINMNEKIYEPYVGTVRLGSYSNIDDAVRKLRLK